MKIKIDKFDYTSTRYYSGFVKIDIGDEAEYKGATYDFTLAETLSADTEHSYVITWLDSIPPDYQPIEEKIIKQFTNGI